MTTCVPLLLCLSLLLHSAFATHPPAPTNLSVNSLNFHHVLRWDPGTRTPPGTEYMVSVSDGDDRWNMTSLIAETATRVVLDPDFKYYLFVTAFYNQSWSPQSSSCQFSPYAETKIGPPEFSLAGYGNYIQINIIVPQADEMANISDIQKYYDADFKVSYRIGNNGAIMELTDQRKTVILKNLKRGVEYCVQVELKINVNKHCQPSAWKCTSTTPVDPQSGHITGLVTGIPIAVLFILTGCLLFLFYAGVICKLREAVPRALRTALTRGYILTPEPTIPDPIIVTSETGRPSNPATSPPADTDSEDDDDDNDDKHYVNRGAGFSSGESSHADSENMSMRSEAAATSDSESSRLLDEVKVKVKVKVKELPAEFEEQVEAVGVCWVKETDQRVWGQSPDEKGVKEDEEVQDTSTNVNLFSVTLASLAARDEEEEEEEAIADSVKESKLECLPATDSQTKSGDHLTPEVLSTHGAFTEGRCTDTLTEDEEEEKEEEEEFSPYLRNK